MPGTVTVALIVPSAFAIRSTMQPVPPPAVNGLPVSDVPAAAAIAAASAGGSITFSTPTPAVLARLYGVPYTLSFESLPRGLVYIGALYKHHLV